MSKADRNHLMELLANLEKVNKSPLSPSADTFHCRFSPVEISRECGSICTDTKGWEFRTFVLPSSARKNEQL
jgi:hypothetical protein